jgi:hypothetical protein
MAANIIKSKPGNSEPFAELDFCCHDTQHNDIQHNDTQHNGIQHKGLNCDTEHK